MMRTLLRGIVVVGLFAGLYAGNAEAVQFDLLNPNYGNIQTDSSGSTSVSWLALNQSTLASVPSPSGLSGSQEGSLSGNALNGITAFLATYAGLQGESLLTRLFTAVRGLELAFDVPGIGNGQDNNNGSRIAVPIPGSFLLFAAGFVGFAAWHNRWRMQ